MSGRSAGAGGGMSDGVLKASDGTDDRSGRRETFRDESAGAEDRREAE